LRQPLQIDKEKHRFTNLPISCQDLEGSNARYSNLPRNRVMSLKFQFILFILPWSLHDVVVDGSDGVIHVLTCAKTCAFRLLSLDFLQSTLSALLHTQDGSATTNFQSRTTSYSNAHCVLRPTVHALDRAQPQYRKPTVSFSDRSGAGAAIERGIFVPSIT
jgi:hypothetical protein